MSVNVFRKFLEAQLRGAERLVRDADGVVVMPLGAPLPDHYAIDLHCRGLVRAPSGEIVEADRFGIGLWFPRDYLERASTFQVVSWLGPANAFHPNLGRGPGGHLFLCIGAIEPGTPLVELVERCHEVITFNNVTMDERNALNHDACAWSRRNQHRFPIDARPLWTERRSFALHDDAAGGAA